MWEWLLAGTLLGGPPWKVLLGLGALGAGLGMIGCGVGVCWSRSARRAGEQPRRW